MRSKTSRWHRVERLLFICLLLYSARSDGAVKFDGWHPYHDTDPITRKPIYEVYEYARADHASGAGYFEVIATCSANSIDLRTTYLTFEDAPNPGFMGAGRGKLLVVRMVMDGDVRTARSLPLQNNNIAIFPYANPLPSNTISDAVDFIAGKLAGTPSELINAKLIRFEIPLADAENPILEIAPQDSEFQKFASQCVKDFPNLSQMRAALDAGKALFNVQSAFRDPNPVSGNMIYLMPDDFATAMNKTGYTVPLGADARTVFLKACGSLPREAFLRAAMNDGRPLLGTPPDQSSKCAQMFGAIKADSTAMRPAGAGGQARFEPMKPGEYHLLIYSYFPGRPNPIYWDEKITLASGRNSFTAGPDNAKPLR